MLLLIKIKIFYTEQQNVGFPIGVSRILEWILPTSLVDSFLIIVNFPHYHLN